MTPRLRVDESATVSIVIPTRNAGPTFRRTLAGARCGAGAEAELVVIDSGSTDGTRKLARDAGATLIEVDPAEFSHGRTRNQAVAATRGEIIVMLVQDAFLLGGALSTLVQELLVDDRCAAVSARHVPRSDADLYAAYVVFAHNEVIGAAPYVPGSPTHADAHRASVAVNDVCAAIRREAWQELGFADVDFAEDLDFGVRAARSGWRIRQSAAAAVAHSHNREALEVFERNILDAGFVPDLTSVKTLGFHRFDPVNVAASAAALLPEVQGMIEALPETAALSAHLRCAGDRLARKAGSSLKQPDLLRIAAAVESRSADATVIGALRIAIVRALECGPMGRFAEAYPAVNRDRAATLIVKASAAAIGRALGEAGRSAAACELDAGAACA